VGGQSDAELIDSARGGNALAFAALYDRYADRVYRHIAYRTGQLSDSEDLTQQTFFKAWQAIGRYQITQAPFVAWLLTIAHNNVVSYFRQQRNHRVLDDTVVKLDERADPYQAIEQQDNAAA